jgi:hypothetical protein
MEFLLGQTQQQFINISDFFFPEAAAVFLE